MMTNTTRRIVGLMAFAVVFSVIGAEIKKTAAPAPTGPAPLISGPAKIILGGTVAAALLSLLAESTEAAQDWAVGLAGVATVTAVLINGAPVWSALNRIFGSAASGSTGPTGPTPTTSGRPTQATVTTGATQP